MKTNKIFYSILVSALFCMAAIESNAQNSLGKTDDVGRIAIKTIVPGGLDIPAAAKKILLTRMTQIASKNGLASYGSRFIMYPRVDVITKDILASAPPKHVYTLNVSLRIADNMTQTIPVIISSNSIHKYYFIYSFFIVLFCYFIRITNFSQTF